MTEHGHGRVAEDGTVYVRRPDGEEVAVGQWAAGDPAEGLAFFERKYDGLRAEADLLLARLKEGKATPESVATVTGKMLGIPKRSIAVRSIPMPKAKPW